MAASARSQPVQDALVLNLCKATWLMHKPLVLTFSGPENGKKILITTTAWNINISESPIRISWREVCHPTWRWGNCMDLGILECAGRIWPTEASTRKKTHWNIANYNETVLIRMQKAWEKNYKQRNSNGCSIQEAYKSGTGVERLWGGVFWCTAVLHHATSFLRYLLHVSFLIAPSWKKIVSHADFYSISNGLMNVALNYYREQKECHPGSPHIDYVKRISPIHEWVEPWIRIQKQREEYGSFVR